MSSIELEKSEAARERLHESIMETTRKLQAEVALGRTDCDTLKEDKLELLDRIKDLSCQLEDLCDQLDKACLRNQ